MHLQAYRIYRPKSILAISLTLCILAAPLIAVAQNGSRILYPPPAPFPAGVFDRAPQQALMFSAETPDALTLQYPGRNLEMAQWQQRLQAGPPPYRARVSNVEYQDEAPPRATPDAPDQSDRLKNSKDPEFILRNFKTMYVQTRNIEFFKSDQMKAALLRNPDFRQLNITMVDDPRVADTVLVVTYTFAWDYPFELRHHNTTEVLLGGKGEGPFSGPLGAADVARQFVNLAKPWRTVKEQK